MDFDQNLADFGCGLEQETSMSKNAAAFLKAYARTCAVINKVSELDGNSSKKELIGDYLDFCYDKQVDKNHAPKNVIDLNFSEGGLEGITSKNLPNVKRDSSSYLYLVEFFTHCCINCIHSIEDVRQVHEVIDEKFRSSVDNCSNGFKGMKVLSIHSPKFPREKDQESIKAFCRRMKMDHSEVVNDPQCVIWNELGVTCWPTLLIMGPNPTGSGPNLLFTLMGEGHKDELLLIVETAMEYFRSSPMQMPEHSEMSHSRDEIPFGVNVSDSMNSFLRFPGKVAVMGDRLVVSDSGNNRLVLLSSTGQVERIIGRPQKGNKDGNLIEAQFYNPQGIAFASESVFYVADTGNHSIRKVDLQLNQVSTLISATTKTKVNDETVEMKSPWDLAFYSSEILFIAAAGNHRLFGYFFSAKTLFGVEHTANSLSVIAGSGREENRNNSYILKASFAQPSGITIMTDDHNEKVIYIADSESSTVRSITPKAQVVGLVGGSRDPTDLFAFGDADGKGVIAKLQHPMGVCAGRNAAEIFVADTYNHKVKRINVESKECITFISTSLNEPSGICKDPSRNLLYVADTNNHSIKVIDLENANICELAILLPDNLNNNKGNFATEKFDKEFLISGFPNGLKLNISMSPLPDAYEGGRWKIISTPGVKIVPTNGEIEKKPDTNEGVFSFYISDNQIEKEVVFFIIADIFFCSENSCLKRTRKIKVICKDDCADKINEKFIFWKDMLWE